jgi:hypothetical protein
MITTFSPPVKQTGVEAVDELTRLMTGNYRPLIITFRENWRSGIAVAVKILII